MEAAAISEDNLHARHRTATLEELAAGMPKEDSFWQVASVFQQISDSTRLRILWLLCHTTASVGAIARAVGMSDSAVSHHLRVLRQDGLVSAKRSGKEVFYSLAASDKARLLHRTIDAMFEIECPSEEE